MNAIRWIKRDVRINQVLTDFLLLPFANILQHKRLTPKKGIITIQALNGPHGVRFRIICYKCGMNRRVLTLTETVAVTRKLVEIRDKLDLPD